MNTLLVLILSLQTPAAHADTLACDDDAAIAHTVNGLGQPRTANSELLGKLAARPALAACHLIRSLHAVRDTHIAGYKQEEYPQTMQVIWAIRGLRYLTGCQDFMAPTSESPAGWTDDRRAWLFRDAAGNPVDQQPKEGLPFFRTWMSRDSVYIAPRDAQLSIINRWTEWYKTTGREGFEYKTCEERDNWYF
jgi:hypothetical protein